MKTLPKTVENALKFRDFLAQYPHRKCPREGLNFSFIRIFYLSLEKNRRHIQLSLYFVNIFITLTVIIGIIYANRKPKSGK
jgi:hypothetical protein